MFAKECNYCLLKLQLKLLKKNSYGNVNKPEKNKIK